MTTDMERLGNSKLWFMTLGLRSKNPRNFKQIEKQKKIEIGKIFPQPHTYIYYYMIHLHSSQKLFVRNCSM